MYMYLNMLYVNILYTRINLVYYLIQCIQFSVNLGSISNLSRISRVLNILFQQVYNSLNAISSNTPTQFCLTKADTVSHAARPPCLVTTACNNILSSISSSSLLPSLSRRENQGGKGFVCFTHYYLPIIQNIAQHMVGRC